MNVSVDTVARSNTSTTRRSVATQSLSLSSRGAITEDEIILISSICCRYTYDKTVTDRCLYLHGNYKINIATFLSKNDISVCFERNRSLSGITQSLSSILGDF